MSLILEALKKLDREKQTPEEHGFVVVASQAWPEPRRNRVVVFSLLGLGLAVALGFVLLARPRQSPPVTAPPAKAVVIPATTPEPPTVSPEAVAPSTPPAATHAAPFESATPLPAPPRAAPPAAASAAVPRVVPVPARPPSLVLQAISERDGKPIALVSDRLVREGDEFDGVRVVRIGDTEVEIEWRGQRSLLRF